jgi:peptide subunit release factor 1 (eRF1)/intein/homing endonuclease
MADKIDINPHSVEELAELVEELEAIRGRHTELVSVLVPAGANVNVVIDQLESEKSTARNIKSSTTRKNVIEALERATRTLRMLGQQTPKKGIAIYSGNISQVEGQEDMRIWAIVPPEELTMRLYRCDQVFIIDPLKEMLKTKELYGLFVIERKEATIGLLDGKKIKILQHIESGVPGKVRAGGQCLSPDTLIMKDDGEIIEIKDTHNPLLVVSENFNDERTEKTPIIAKWENNKQLFKITTKYPKLDISASKDHTFFVRTDRGIEEKTLSELKEGDFLIMPEKIDLNLEDQKISFTPKIKQSFNMKLPIIPEKIDPLFSKILGYYLGDGSYELDRITFFEQRKEVAEHYKNLIEDVFKIEVKSGFRADKNYFQLRVYSRIISQLFKTMFNEKEKTLNQKIPSIILKSSDKSLASFLAGFFDAEGYISSNRVGLGINNKILAKQIQLSLLRLGIISSIWEYDHRKNPFSDNIRYTISIDDGTSLNRFYQQIGFSSKEKNNKLELALKNRKNRSNVRQLVINGRDVARILRNSGVLTDTFKCPGFFVNKRQISKEVFKERILDKIINNDLKKRLEFIYNSNLILAKIQKIEKLNISKTIDIETKNHNFIANGLVVHNSAARYARITEGAAKQFYRECAEALKNHFFDMKNLKGIIVGGPMPTKDDFIKEGLLVTALKNKIIGMVDIGYADEHGIEMLVEASKDLLKEQEIIKEKKLMDGFFDMLGKQRDKTAYGNESVRKALGLAAVDTLFLSKKLDKKTIAEFKKIAEETSAKVELVSVETQEGEQFYNLSGIGAILRYKL